MKKLTTVMFAAALAFAATGCKKKDAPAGGGSAGSAAKATDPGSGGTMAGSDTMPGSGATMAGSDSMAGSGSSMAGSGSSMAGGTRPAAITDEMVAVAEKMVAEIKAMGTDLKAAGTDCKKADAALKTHYDALIKIVGEAEKFKDKTDKDPAAKDWFKTTYMNQMDSDIQALMAAAMACKDDKAFMETLKKFPLKKKKDAKDAANAPTGSGSPAVVK